MGASTPTSGKPSGKRRPPRPALRRAGGSVGAAAPRPTARASPADGNLPEVEGDDDRVRQALAASSRAEASLSALLKAVQDASSGFAGARQANEVLLEELGRIRQQLQQSEAARGELERTLPQLMAQRDGVQLALARAEEEREQVLDEHDDFLASLIEEHEDELAELRRHHVADILAQSQAAVARDRDQRERAIEHLERRHRDEIAALRRANEGEVAKLKQTYEKQAKTNRIEFERQLVTERTAAEKKRRTEHERDITAVRDELAAERSRHAAEVELLKEEYEALLAAAAAEREQAEQRLARLEQAAEAGRAARQRIQAAVPGVQLPADPIEVDRIRLELQDVRQQLDALSLERDQSREMLRRLQMQRDEAYRRANELHQGLIPERDASSAESRPGDAESADPPTRESELAAALAATDPRRRRQAGGVRERRIDQPRPDKVVSRGKADTSSHPLVGYSVSEVEPEITTTNPPRRS